MGETGGGITIRIPRRVLRAAGFVLFAAVFVAAGVGVGLAVGGDDEGRSEVAAGRETRRGPRTTTTSTTSTTTTTLAAPAPEGTGASSSNGNSGGGEGGGGGDQGAVAPPAAPPPAPEPTASVSVQANCAPGALATLRVTWSSQNAAYVELSVDPVAGAYTRKGTTAGSQTWNPPCDGSMVVARLRAVSADGRIGFASTGGRMS